MIRYKDIAFKDIELIKYPKKHLQLKKQEEKTKS